MLHAVDLSTTLLDKRPAQLSGGQLQRVCTLAPGGAAAAVDLDEAVSNLDLLLQAEIIALLKRLQARFGTACLFITHDLRLVERFCQRVLVMEHGRIVETATVSLPLRLRSLPDRRSSRRCCHLSCHSAQRGHAMQRVTLTLDDDLLAALDALSARRGYHNRSEAVRDILRDALTRSRAVGAAARLCRPVICLRA